VFVSVVRLDPSSVQFGVELTEDVVEAINAEVVDLAALPAELAPRVAQLLSREPVQAVRRSLNHFHLNAPTNESP